MNTSGNHPNSALAPDSNAAVVAGVRSWDNEMQKAFKGIRTRKERRRAFMFYAARKTSEA